MKWCVRTTRGCEWLPSANEIAAAEVWLILIKSSRLVWVRSESGLSRGWAGIAGKRVSASTADMRTDSAPDLEDVAVKSPDDLGKRPVRKKTGCIIAPPSRSITVGTWI